MVFYKTMLFWETQGDVPVVLLGYFEMLLNNRSRFVILSNHSDGSNIATTQQVRPLVFLPCVAIWVP